MSEPLASNTRPYVDAFADAMEAKLADNRHKGDRDGWAAMPAHRLLDLMRGEVEELAAALVAASPQDVVSECADVANFAMMIADVAGGLAPKIEPREVRVPVPEGVRVVLVSEQFVDSFEARSVDGSRRIKARLGQPNAHGVSDLTFESHDEPLPALAAAQAENVRLREALAHLGSRFVVHSDKHGPNIDDAVAEQHAQSALSIPPGSRDALRALLTEAVERARREEATDSALIASLLGEDS